MRPIVLLEHKVDIVIPKFDDGLKEYLGNRVLGVWVCDVARNKVIWGNKAAPETWGTSNMKEFLKLDLTQGVAAKREAAKMFLMDALKQPCAIHPWSFHHKKRVDAVRYNVRHSGVNVNGELHVMGEVIEAGSASSEDGVVGQRDVANTGAQKIKLSVLHEAAKFLPTKLTIISDDEKIMYQNLRAESYYRSVTNDYSKAVKEGSRALLQPVLQSCSSNDNLYEKLMRLFDHDDEFSESLAVPPTSARTKTWHRWQASRLLDTSTGKYIILLCQNDITEWKEMFDNEAYNEKRKNKLHTDRLIHAVSHELRTPLINVIDLSDELMHNTELNEFLNSNASVAKLSNAKRSIRMIHETGNHLSEVVDRLLHVSRMTKPNVQLQWTYVNLKQLMEQTFAKFPISDSISLSKSIPSDLPLITAEESSIHVVFDVLYANAIKFTTFGFIKVTVDHRIRDSAGYVIVSVEDSGIGIHEQDFERIFELFEQVDNSDGRTHQGAGIGLHLAKSIVESHGGSIFVQSELNEGSKFTFSIPYRPDEIVE